MDRLHVATLNILNIAERWQSRLPLLLADFAALQPDVIGLQEVVYAVEQDRVIASGGAARYVLHRGWAGRPEYGNSLLVREGIVAGEPDRVDLGEERAANRVVLTLSGSRVVAAVTHLHHVSADAEIRERQAREVVAWLDAAPSADAQFLVGDFNAPPDEPACSVMAGGGFRSAYREANGDEPEVTWPTGLAKLVPDTDPPRCLDYIWVRGEVRVADARLVFDRPAAEDRSLYPSDHAGISVHLEIGG